jgi:hypothetical protein
MQEKLRSYTDEQVEAKIAAEREKLALAAKLGRKESDERRSSTDVMKAVSNAERSNAKLRCVDAELVVLDSRLAE